jgi:hypothetical protein
VRNALGGSVRNTALEGLHEHALLRVENLGKVAAAASRDGGQREREREGGD